MCLSPQIRLITLFLSSLSFSLGLSAQTIPKKIDTIPYVLSVYNNPVYFEVKSTELVITATGKTNLFNNPNGQSKVTNAPLILFEPAGDFTLSARVTGNLKAIYDVAALVVYQNENQWAKLCYENSVLKQPTIVSVVTRTLSDDCNSQTTGEYAFLSIVKKGDQYSFFYSVDGLSWSMVRSFQLETKERVKVGFAAHGSRGDGFTGCFSEINYQEKALDDMRGF